MVPEECGALGWEYIIRIHEDFWVHLEGSKAWQPVSSLRPGRYRWAEIRKGEPDKEYLWCTRE